MAVLHFLFPQRVISRVGALASLFAVPNNTWFFSVGLFESEGYSRHPVDLNALKQAMRDKIINISNETLLWVMRSFSTHMHLCIQEGGGHPKDIVHKKVQQCKTNLSTVGNYNMLKSSVITLSKMLFVFIISSLFLPDPVYWPLYMIASAHCSILGLTAVTGWTKQGKARSSVFHVSKGVTLLTQPPTVLLSTVALPWTLQRLLCMFPNDFFSATRNSITACCT